MLSHTWLARLCGVLSYSAIEAHTEISEETRGWGNVDRRAPPYLWGTEAAEMWPEETGWDPCPAVGLSLSTRPWLPLTPNVGE